MKLCLKLKTVIAFENSIEILLVFVNVVEAFRHLPMRNFSSGSAAFLAQFFPRRDVAHSCAGAPDYLCSLQNPERDHPSLAHLSVSKLLIHS